jgi:hypothetical protein
MVPFQPGPGNDLELATLVVFPAGDMLTVHK